MKNYFNHFRYTIIKRLMSTNKNIQDDINKIDSINKNTRCSTSEHGTEPTFEVEAGKGVESTVRGKNIVNEDTSIKNKTNDERRYEKGDKIEVSGEKGKDFPHGYDKI
jgi:hypothetical protein